MSNKYWNGSEHAVLKKADISAKWINGPSGGRGLGVTNKAFCIWYHGRKVADDNIMSNMNKTLEDCGYSGWGTGVNDLDEAFKHLVANNGKWTDNTTESFGAYNGKCGEYQGGTSGINVQNDSIPPSVSNFLTAVDKAAEKFQSSIKTYQDKAKVIKALNIDKTSPKPDWEKMKTNIDDVKKAAEKVKDYAWLGPVALEFKLPRNSASNLTALKKATETADYLSDRAGKAVKFLDVVGKIHDSITLYDQAKKAFDGNEKAAAALVALTQAMTYVPVLGGFYGEIVKRIPSLAINWKAFINDYTSRIDDPIAYQLKQQNAQPKWKCSECGSM